MIEKEKMLVHVRQHPYPLLFTTVSGAHLYGFPSPDSDFDLRGVHLLPLNEVIGLKTTNETIEKEGIYDGLEIDLVTHDLKKFFGLLLKRNGYVLEQLMSPIVVHSSPEHEELQSIATKCITRHHVHHYLGFAKTQWKLFEKESKARVKPLLYVYRVLLTGIHLMQTGEVQANLLELNKMYGLHYLDELIAKKREGPEKGELGSSNLKFHQNEFVRLENDLRSAADNSKLPEAPSAAPALNDLLIRIRLKQQD